MPKWLCLCVLLIASSEVLVIDNFETTRNWEPVAFDGTIKIILDRVHTKEGETSLRMDVEFSACTERDCYAGITCKAPDLTGYKFLRLWIKADEAENVMVGLVVTLFDGEQYFYVVPLDTSGWRLVTAPFSNFEHEKGLNPLAPENIERISLFVAAEEQTKVRVYFDALMALIDANDNQIPDVDEGSMAEEAHNAEEMGDVYVDEGSYERAEKYYEEAKLLYQQIGDDKKAQEMDLKVKSSKGWLKFEEAEQLYGEEKYAMAEDAYDEARKYFVAAGDLEMVDYIESRLEELREGTEEVVPSGEPSETPAQAEEGGVFGLLFVFFVVFLVGAGIYVWKFRGKEPEKVVPKSKEEIIPKEIEPKEEIKPKEIEPKPKEIEPKPKEKPVKESKEDETLTFSAESEHLICPVCGNNIDEDWVSCPYCGVKLQDDTQVY